MSKPTTVPCPTCKTEIQWSSDNPYRPFCCERCKLIDLGAWASEEHAIPGEPLEDVFSTQLPDSLH